MDHEKQIAHFTTELNALTERYQMEYTMPYQTLIGVLDLHKSILIEEALGLSYEVDEPPEDEQ
jgi:hypothetical protein